MYDMETPTHPVKEADQLPDDLPTLGTVFWLIAVFILSVTIMFAIALLHN